MDHVSTLCALSTVGIASTGLALGRIERSKPSLLRRKTLSHDQSLPPTPVRSTTPVDARPRTSLSARPGPAGADWTSNARWADENEYPRGIQSQETDLRRASLSFGASRRRRRGQTLTNPPLRIPEHEATDSHSRSHSRRPSTGWLRRLSLVSFQSESPSTNSPVTPSFNGSASPILPRPSSQRRSPNKLVKRSPSQHSTHPLLINTAVPPASGLRRPATSYQRSETRRWQSPLAGDFESRFSESVSVDSPAVEEFNLHSKETWEPYLIPKSEGFSERMARKLPTPGSPKAQGVRRIISDQDTAPALVLASTIITKASESDYQPIPTTPVDFRNPFHADNSAPSPAPVPERPAHKHSFSLNDAEPKRIVVNTVTASGTPIVGRPRGGSLKRVKGRTFSIPRSELPKPESIVLCSPPQPQRRNVTDPIVFRRPHMVSPGLAPSTFGRDPRVAPRSVSQDYNVGMRRQHPLTPDAVALSAWQQSFRPASYTYSSLRRRPKRHSIAASDPSSTIIGSDDTRVFTSADEYETDVMSDYWDSIRTRETSGSELKGLRIETMFDKAGAQLSNEEVTTLEDLLPHGSFASRMEKDPPLFPGTLVSPVAHVRANDTASICEEDEERDSMIGALPGEADGPSLQTPLASSFSKQTKIHDPEASPLDLLLPDSPLEDSRIGQKMNIFDWSEQTRSDRDMSDSEARPRTVHGKQNGLDRGSRAACRKVPSTIHLRSQSVPVARDIPASDSRQTSGKFGTWGLGSKGVSEDWDSDFDFEDGGEAPASPNSKTAESDAAPQSMTVPKAILERQASLRGQFGQVQELTLLVEELKRLRHQASVLDLVGGPSSELWKEAEGIVNLATIDEEDRRSPPGSPSSLTFSFDDSDDEGPNVASKRDSEGSWQATPRQGSQLLSPRQPTESSEDTWQTPSHSSSLKQLSKESPKSKSVLDILQSGQRPQDSTLPGLTPAPRTQKLPFDTQSLRDLVVRAGVITRALKEVIRKAEGVDPSPQDVFPSDPPFRRIFDQPSHDDLASFEAALAEMH